MKESEADNIHVGTTEYMAPELHVRSPQSTKMDVYSFGILLWKLFNPYTYPYPKHDPVSYGGGKRHRLHLLRYGPVPHAVWRVCGGAVVRWCVCGGLTQCGKGWCTRAPGRR